MLCITLAKEKKELRKRYIYWHYIYIYTTSLWVLFSLSTLYFKTVDWSLHANKTMGKECCSPLSWHLWGGTKKQAPLKTLGWQAGSVAVGVQQFSQKRLKLKLIIYMTSYWGPSVSPNSALDLIAFHAMIVEDISFWNKYVMSNNSICYNINGHSKD